MVKDQGCCHECGQKLDTKEDDVSTLMVCTNKICNNYWVNEGCEIVMVLK